MIEAFDNSQFFFSLSLKLLNFSTNNNRSLQVDLNPTAFVSGNGNEFNSENNSYYRQAAKAVHNNNTSKAPYCQLTIRLEDIYAPLPQHSNNHEL